MFLNLCIVILRCKIIPFPIPSLPFWICLLKYFFKRKKKKGMAEVESWCLYQEVYVKHLES